MDQDGTWCSGRPQPRPHCVRWGPSPVQQLLPTFGPCLLWPNGRLSKQLLSSCYKRSPKNRCISPLMVNENTWFVNLVCCLYRLDQISKFLPQHRSNFPASSWKRGPATLIVIIRECDVRGESVWKIFCSKWAINVAIKILARVTIYDGVISLCGYSQWICDLFVQPWTFLARFCFLSGTGRLNYSLAFPAVSFVCSVAMSFAYFILCIWVHIYVELINC